jgi:two-component system KDP operon response regulator KdpE
MSPVSPSVVVVEPDLVQRDLIRLALTRAGCDVVTASTGKAAAELLKSKQPALLLLDLFLPQQNGIDLLQQLRAAGLLAHTAVVVISGLGFSEVVQQAVQSGAQDFLVKPIDTDQLVERVNKVLKR